ncbi:hypothetical protein [Sphingosinicella sp. BN140058]|uniref:hypothetical protein n=1 Tax=Sphingosinicella sp. BN140058 TaxID=1892855 RepID=UPI001012E200|nr:hypothetical protein [Sphingosinicella sp. BN140058]QAY77925.1 hypothetical protein ETR14_16395 [Sphingosinicella sp. BN140058]
MGARIKGQRERIITLAHQIEAMARQKKLNPLAKYLQHKKRAHGGGDAAVVGMLEDLRAKGMHVKITRLKPAST